MHRNEMYSRPVPTRLSGVPSCLRPSCSVIISECVDNRCKQVVYLTSGLVVGHIDSCVWVVGEIGENWGDE